jgi:uncharacterized membrane protein
MKQYFIKYKGLIPVLILTVFSAYSVIYTLANMMTEWDKHFLFTSKHYAALVILTMNYIAFFKYRHYYKYTLLITLLLGFCNFVSFTVDEYNGYIQFNSIKFYVQPVFFLICVITYLLNFKRVNNSLKQAFQSPPEYAAKKEIADYSEQLEKFKMLYSNYSDEQLQTIITEGKHTSQAINAARQILNERKSLQEKLS